MAAHLSVELDSPDGVGVAVIADLRLLLEVVDVHALRHGGAHYNHQTAGEQTLHDVHIWSLCWGGVTQVVMGRCFMLRLLDPYHADIRTWNSLSLLVR